MNFLEQLLKRLNKRSIVGRSENFCHKPTILFQDLSSQFQRRQRKTVLFEGIVRPILADIRSTVMKNTVYLNMF
jgi:hypothetical protein